MEARIQLSKKRITLLQKQVKQGAAVADEEELPSKPTTPKASERESIAEQSKRLASRIREKYRIGLEVPIATFNIIPYRRDLQGAR